METPSSHHTIVAPTPPGTGRRRRVIPTRDAAAALAEPTTRQPFESAALWAASAMAASMLLRAPRPRRATAFVVRWVAPLLLLGFCKALMNGSRSAPSRRAC